MDYRQIDVTATTFSKAEEVRAGGWASVINQTVTFQTPPMPLLCGVDSTTSTLDLDPAQIPEFIDFVKSLEGVFQRHVLDNQELWFGNNVCTIDCFNSHVKDDSVRFSSRGTVLFDAQNRVVDAIPSFSVVSALVEVSDGWFWQGQWGLKIKCTQVKSHGQMAKQSCGFIEDGKDAPSISCGFLD